jgi:hypothetical protein
VTVQRVALVLGQHHDLQVAAVTRLDSTKSTSR